MKKLDQLKLTNIDKKELEAKQMNLLKGGELCNCTCGCATSCSCTGEPMSNQSSNSSFWSGVESSNDSNVEAVSGHGVIE